MSLLELVRGLRRPRAVLAPGRRGAARGAAGRGGARVRRRGARPAAAGAAGPARRSLGPRRRGHGRSRRVSGAGRRKCRPVQPAAGAAAGRSSRRTSFTPTVSSSTCWRRAWRRPRPRVVWHIHEYVSGRPISRALLRRYAPRCAAVVANSQQRRRGHHGRCSATAAPVTRIYNAVDSIEFSPEGDVLDLDRARRTAGRQSGHGPRRPGGDVRPMERTCDRSSTPSRRLEPARPVPRLCRRRRVVRHRRQPACPRGARGSDRRGRPRRAGSA